MLIMERGTNTTLITDGVDHTMSVSGSQLSGIKCGCGEQASVHGTDGKSRCISCHERWAKAQVNRKETPRQYSLVRFCADGIPPECLDKYPFTDDSAHVYVFFGEIPNMPGHCIVADHKTGQIFSGFHTENFIELTEDEL